MGAAKAAAWQYCKNAEEKKNGDNISNTRSYIKLKFEILIEISCLPGIR